MRTTRLPPPQTDEEVAEQMREAQTMVARAEAVDRARELAELEELDDQEGGDLLRGIDELRSVEGVQFQIIRILPAESEGYMRAMSSAEFSLDNIQREFGAGTYRIRVKGPRGYIKGGGTVKIGPRPVNLSNTPSPSSGSSSDNFGEWERRDDMRRERARKERLEMLTIVGPIAGPIIAALVGRQGPDLAGLITALKPPPAPTMPEMMEGLAKLKALAPEQTTDPLDRALKLLDVIADKAPSGGETGWIDLAREAIKAVAPSIAPMIEAKLAQTPITVDSARAAPARLVNLPGAVSVNAPIASGVAASLENPPMFGMMQLIPWLQEQMTMALQKAERASDPEFIAERILDDLPERVDLVQLLGFIERADWFAQLAKLDARVHQHGSWFELMRVALIRGLREELNLPPANTASSELREVDRPGAEPPSLWPTEPKG